jgi:hypothetical protein
MGVSEDFTKLSPLAALALQQQSGPQGSPVVSRERFADMIGLPIGVVVGWCNKGLIPCVTVGKYSLINVELLRKQCLSKEFA